MPDNLGVPANRSWSSKTGQVNENGIVCDRLCRITPPIYECRCGSCGVSFQASHAKFPTTVCPNQMAHGRADRTRSQTTITISPSTATRSADSAAFREYQREQEQRKVRYSFRGEPTFQNADPSSIAAWLEQEGR